MHAECFVLLARHLLEKFLDEAGLHRLLVKRIFDKVDHGRTGSITVTWLQPACQHTLVAMTGTFSGFCVGIVWLSYGERLKDLGHF